MSLRQSVVEDTELKDNLSSPGSVGSKSTHQRDRRRKSRKNNKMEREELEKEKVRLDEKASQFAFECEKRGMRTSYDELRNLLVGCTLPPKAGHDESASNNEEGTGNSLTPQRKPPSAFMTPSRNVPNTNLDDLTIEDSNSLLMADSIGGMFETGKSKKYNLSSRCVPSLPDNKTAKAVTQNVTNAARNAATCFMPEDGDNLDEDGDGTDFYADGQRTAKRRGDRGSLMLDIPTSPIKAEGRQRGGGGDSIAYANSEQQLYPVVMVFRRTVQRKQLVSSRKGLWGSPGLSLRGSLFGIPSFRMDDECDRAAALVRQLSNNKKRGNTDGIFFGDDGENSTITSPSVATSSDQRSGGVPNDDNIEASTIRGMIQSALGLGFVRTSKVSSETNNHPPPISFTDNRPNATGCCWSILTSWFRHNYCKASRWNMVCSLCYWSIWSWSWDAIRTGSC
jgi:hypothetical protein